MVQPEPRWMRPVGLAVALLIGVLACNTPAQPPNEEPAPATLPPTPDDQPPRVADLARATVQILALERQGGSWEPIWSGSGTIFSPEGLILTNAHVIDDRYGEYDELGVAVLVASDQPPELIYLAEIAAADYALDLAVIRIISDVQGNPIQPSLPFILLGDSDRVEIGDNLQILGYPGIGGDTITFTEGVVSGFTSERNITGRAWIKTDATIAGGNSGGVAANTAGELIGVPTRASSGAEDAAVVDCRLIADTNGDGDIDDRDTCVPIGGFINGLRPVNLALPLIDAVRGGVAYQGPPSPPPPSGGYDLSETVFRSLVFSDGVTADDRPIGIYDSLPGRVSNVCAFWDYEGMAGGMIWSAYWFVDGTLDEGGSILDQTWDGGPQGNWWVCIFNGDGLPDALYEVVLEVEGDVLITDAIFVGGDHPPAEFTLSNQSGTTAYYVLISPSLAQNWGQDHLGATEVLPSGTSRLFAIPGGTYDLLILDSDFGTLVEVYGLDITGDLTFSFPPGASGAPTQPDVGMTNLRLINDSGFTVCYIYISPVTSQYWGQDWLGPNETIATGFSRDFDLQPGDYDLRADACNRETLVERRGVTITGEGITWTLTR